MMETEKGQKALVEIVAELRRLDERLGEVAAALPAPVDEERMLEGEIPPDAATEVRGTINYCREEQLSQLIDYLDGVSQVSEEDLRRDFALRSSEGESSEVH